MKMIFKQLVSFFVVLQVALLNGADAITYSFENKTGGTIKVTLNNASQTNTQISNGKTATLSSRTLVDSFRITFGSYQKNFSATNSKLGLPSKKVSGETVFETFNAKVTLDPKDKENLKFALN